MRICIPPSLPNRIPGRNTDDSLGQYPGRPVSSAPASRVILRPAQWYPQSWSWGLDDGIEPRSVPTGCVDGKSFDGRSKLVSGGRRCEASLILALLAVKFKTIRIFL